MRQYNIFQAIVMSFYSGKLYKDVATNWGAMSFLYLILIISLCWIIPTYQIQVALTQGYEAFSDEMVNQIPIVTIKEGKLSTPEKRPYLITGTSSKDPLIIIDTTGKYTSLDQTKAAVLVTETEVITSPKPGETKVDKIPPSADLVIEPTVVKKFVGNLLVYAWIFVFLIAVIIVYVLRLIQALFYGIIGKIFSAIFKVKLSYTQVVQIAMVAITPPMILATVLDVFNITFPSQLLCYFVLAMVYLFYGVISNRE